MRLNFLIAIAVASAIIATPLAASAQGSTDRNGNAMGSEKVGNGTPRTTAPGTTGSNVGPNGSNHPSPSSSQGDVGPEGTNNGTLTTKKK